MDTRQFIRTELAAFRRGYLDVLLSAIRNEMMDLPPIRPHKDFEANLMSLVNHFDNEPIPASNLTPGQRAVLKTVLLFRRHQLAEQIAEAKQRTNSPESIASLDNLLEAFSEALNLDCLIHVEPAKLPRLIDVLILERVESLSTIKPLSKREYDEKFKILQAPNQILTDLAFYRDRCGMRDISLAVIYLDIDKFKEFNTELGETMVDLHVLPRFMALLESHVYGKGYAFRQGGDEYCIILPNADRKTTVFFLATLRQKLARFEYEKTKKRTTVSMGFVVIEPDCPLSNADLIHRAKKAKNYAKASGRDCLATYCDSSFEDTKLIIESIERTK